MYLMKRSLLSYLTGASDAKLISSKKEVAYLFEKVNNPEIADDLERFVSKEYEKANNVAFRHLGQIARSGAKLQSSEQIMNNDFVDRFIEVYGFGFFVNAITVGYELKAGTLSTKRKKELGIVMDDINLRMMKDAKQSYDSIKIAECFSSTGRVLADIGADTGEKIYMQENKFIYKKRKNSTLSECIQIFKDTVNKPGNKNI